MGLWAATTFRALQFRKTCIKMHFFRWSFFFLNILSTEWLGFVTSVDSQSVNNMLSRARHWKIFISTEIIESEDCVSFLARVLLGNSYPIPENMLIQMIHTRWFERSNLRNRCATCCFFFARCCRNCRTRKPHMCVCCVSMHASGRASLSMPMKEFASSHFTI